MELSNALGRDVNFRSASDFKRFFQNLKRQKYDIALIQPFWYPPAVDEFGYLPVVRMREPLVSLIMLPEDSQIRSLEDKAGQLDEQGKAYLQRIRNATEQMGLLIDNLLGNAWKYSDKQARARIKFGRSDKGGDETNFIKDNGIGFDMRFADKLFSSFQHLHKASEYEGTGIGLATVQRIIHRHGGGI